MMVLPKSARLGVLTLAALSLFLLQGAAESAEPRAGFRVEVPGARDAEPATLSARVEGQEARVLDVAAVGPLQMTVYVDRLLSAPVPVHEGLLDLATASPELVRLGSVEVVTAREGITTSVPRTRSAEQLAEAFGWLRLRETGEGGQLVVRRRFLEETQLADWAENPHLAVSAIAGQRMAELGVFLREALAEEALLLSRYRQQLLDWAVEHPLESPGVLFLVGGGFDAEPEAFYRALLEPFDLAETVDDQPPVEIEPSISELAQTLSALGWSVWSFGPEGSGELLDEQGRKKGNAEVITTYEGGRRVDKTVITPQFDALKRIKQLMAGRGKPVPEAALLEPYAPLEILAAESGGEVLTSRAQLIRAVGDLAQRLSVLVELPADTSPLAPVDVKWEEKPAASVRRWASRGSPPLVGEVRARKLLDGELGEGGLFVEATAMPAAEDSSAAMRLEVVVGRTLERSDTTPFSEFELTAVAFVDGGIETERFQVAPDRGGDGAFSVEVGDVSGAVAPDTPVVVVIEEPESGLWGGAYAVVVNQTGYDALGSFGGLLPAPRAIHLLAPREPLAVGKTKVETVLSDRVRKVEFFLDGKLEVVRRSAPFSVSVVLGKYPDRHTVEAVAFDERNLEIGRDRLILNAGTGTFRVRIVDPADPGDPSSPLTGPVTARAALEIPRGSELARLQFYWNEDLMATRFAPPFAHRFLLPDDGGSGFIRAVAVLTDGSETEDVLFVNSPGGSEQVRVELVELFTVVTDRQGRPVTRLPADRFRVFEDGVEQEVASFNEAGDLPLTVGLAIDSSASMFVKLPEVQEAAADFVRSLGPDRDRAFVVRFGGGPELISDTTPDMAGVERALYALEPDGRTEIWKGIVYSLVQLQAVPGKKALIVFSDGADEDPDFSYRTCLRFARRVGVPVYVIVSNDEIYRTDGKGLTIKGFMNRLEGLVRSVGGRVFVTRVGGDLTDIYSRINEELRSQYLLGYYARDVGGDRWREVKVDVSGSGLKARTISGYFR